jgi:transcriptional regulator GlxA family with amidase domain
METNNCKRSSEMKRRDFLATTTAACTLATGANLTRSILTQKKSGNIPTDQAADDKFKLIAPSKGRIPIAFAISEGVTVIDFCGPWEVFQDVTLPGSSQDSEGPFELFTVSEKTEPLRGSAGLKIVPNYTFETAPSPKLVLVPAQSGSAALHEWLRHTSPRTDLTMSVCTGAFQLAKAGLLSGKSATTHHEFIDRLAKEYPDIDVKRGLRFVEGERISTAGGLTSGIDLALRVVERYFGRSVAESTAFYMEYQSKGWVVG